MRPCLPGRVFATGGAPVERGHERRLAVVLHADSCGPASRASPRSREPGSRRLLRAGIEQPRPFTGRTENILHNLRIVTQADPTLQDVNCFRPPPDHMNVDVSTQIEVVPQALVMNESHAICGQIVVRMRLAGLLLAILFIASSPTAEARPGVPTAANFCKLKPGTIDKPGSYTRTALYRMGKPDEDYRRLPRNSEFDPSMSWITRRFIFRAFLTSGASRILSLNIERRGRWRPPCDEVRPNETLTPPSLEPLP